MIRHTFHHQEIPTGEKSVIEKCLVCGFERVRYAGGWYGMQKPVQGISHYDPPPCIKLQKEVRERIIKRSARNIEFELERKLGKEAPQNPTQNQPIRRPAAVYSNVQYIEKQLRNYLGEA